MMNNRFDLGPDFGRSHIASGVSRASFPRFAWECMPGRFAPGFRKKTVEYGTNDSSMTGGENRGSAPLLSRDAGKVTRASSSGRILRRSHSAETRRARPGWPGYHPSRKVLFIVYAFLAVLLLSAGTDARAQSPSADDGFSAGDIFVYPMRFYQKYLSGADGDRCPMHPSCSSYGIQAVKKHGPLLGYFMACDRLMRCGRDEKYIGQPIMKDGKQKIYDPISNNDFWWYDNKATGKKSMEEKGMEEKAAEEKGAER